MATTKMYEHKPTVKSGGFNFDNCERNLALEKLGVDAPKLRSTGTTIAGVIYKDGIVMGADSRATAGNIVADKHCMKVHKLTDSIYACGAGTAADLDQVCLMLSANLRLYEMNNKCKADILMAVRRSRQHLFRHMGYICAYLLIGGVDSTGAHLYSVHAHGSSATRPYAAEGSGSYSAMSVLERDYKPNMTENEATELLQRVIESGMHADNASGNSLNLIIIQTNGKDTVFRGPIVPDFCRMTEPFDLVYKASDKVMQVLKQKTIPYEVLDETEEPMEVSHVDA